MSGKIKQMIDSIIEQRSRQNPALVGLTRAKLLLKGIDPSKFNNSSEDNPDIMKKLKSIAQELGLKL